MPAAPDKRRSVRRAQVKNMRTGIVRPASEKMMQKEIGSSSFGQKVPPGAGKNKIAGEK
jgi:hypothetical protein